MGYTAQTWVDGAAGGTPISAARLNHIEAGLVDLDERLTAAAAGAAATGVHGAGGVDPLTGYHLAAGRPGIDPTGRTDSTDAMNALHAGVPAGSTVFYGPGTYRVTGTLVQPAFQVTVTGAGHGTVWRFDPARPGTLMTITGRSYLTFATMAFEFEASAAAAASTLFLLANTFSCRFHRCAFRGQHARPADGYGVATGHIGVALAANAGDNVFFDCLWANLGVGVATDSIQNAIVGGRFATCWIGVHGTSDIAGSGQADSGMSLAGYVSFVSDAASPGLVHRNVLIDGPAGQWWLSQVWTEGADVAIEVGSAAGGPSQFVMSASKIAALTTCILLNSADWPTISGVQVGTGTVGFAIDPRVDHGTADGLTSNIESDAQLSAGVYEPRTFPPGWVLNGVPVPTTG